MSRIITLTVALALTASAEFTLNDDGKKLTIMDGKKPVLVYNYGFVDPPDNVPAKYRRACYIHPLYGIDGKVITEDFPKDHYHHRGVFWAWPNCKVGDRKMDIWIGDGVHQVFEKWTERAADAEKARIGVENVWQFDGETAPQIREHIVFTVHPVQGNGRAIDFDLRFENVSGKDISILGSPVEKKGYGGLCIRPRKDNSPFTFTTASGVVPDDALSCQTPWADCSWKSGGAGQAAGVAIFQNPADPGYPHPGWIFRHYAFLGVSWPHNDEYHLKPGESFRLQYRMYVHNGTAEKAGIAKAFGDYIHAAGS